LASALIVRRVMERHGGTVSAGESTLGEHLDSQVARRAA
jgi:hypothetical protein